MIRWHVVRAVFKRNFTAYFTSPTGYVFITIFIFLAAIIAFYREKFFQSNLANLDTLNDLFPYLLLFFVPTITMSTWAEERRQGTDELLMTLPARDIELVIGKYLSALGIYTVALFFSLDFILVLALLGHPDIGVMLGTYLGYWFIGATMLAVGMVGSLLTGSMTVAFILGALFCAAPVFISHIGMVGDLPLIRGWESLRHFLKQDLQNWGALEPFRELSTGIFSIKTLAYFASLSALMLYLNLILLARRHIAGGAGSGRAWLHFATRALCVLVAAVSLTVLAGRYGTRIDLTQERLHSLSRTTRDVILKIDPEQPVIIQAFVTPEVPRDYVETRENLLSLLREYAAIGHERIQLRVVDTKRYSPEAREADEAFGIKAEEVPTEEGRGPVVGFFLGVAMTCRGRDIKIPFMYRGLSPEYELTKALTTVTTVKRKKLGLVVTGAKLIEDFDMEQRSMLPAWQILDELRTQYEVVDVTPDHPIGEKFDVLLVPMPSTLPQIQMDNVLAYIKRGGPAMIFEDPFPYFKPSLAPSQRQARTNPYAPPQEPKGDIAGFMRQIGISWPADDVVWDTWNPHDRAKGFPQEIVFIGAGSGAKDSFNPDDPTTSGLQEIVLPWGGHIQPVPGSPLTFTPLLHTTSHGGVLAFGDLMTSFRSRRPPAHRLTGHDYVPAARVKGAIAQPPSSDGKEPATINVVVIADMDLMSDILEAWRRMGISDLNFDNFTFVFNCVDVLSGNDSLVSLRKRRPKHRTLEEVERRNKEHKQRMLDDVKKAEEKAKQEEDDANQRYKDKTSDLSSGSIEDKIASLQNVNEIEERRKEQAIKRITDEKETAIERSRETLDQAVESIQNRIKFLAVVATPSPALLIGLIVFLVRLLRERRTA